MKNFLSLAICVMVLSVPASGKRVHRSHAKPKLVTTTGCIAAGTECLVLTSSSGTKKYSVPKSDKLQVGHSYRITGSVSTIGICMEGLPILSPRKITEIRLRCPR
jgi:hypothetical protein